MLQKPASTFLYVVLGVVGMVGMIVALGLGFFLSQPSYSRRIFAHSPMRKVLSETLPFVNEYEVRIENNLNDYKVVADKKELVRLGKRVNLFDGPGIFYGVVNGERIIVDPQVLTLTLTHVEPQQASFYWNLNISGETEQYYALNSFLKPESREVELVLWVDKEFLEGVEESVVNHKLSSAVITGMLDATSGLRTQNDKNIVEQAENMLNELSYSIITVK